MNNAPDGLLILADLGGGVLGSIVTTYGTQAKERRDAGFVRDGAEAHRASLALQLFYGPVRG